MRLLDTKTGQFLYKTPEETVYAILSHTWDPENGEQTYEELKKIQQRYLLDLQASQTRPVGPGGGAPSSSGRAHIPVRTSTAAPSANDLPAALNDPLPNSLNNPSTPTPDRLPQSIWDDPELSPKIRDACAIARANGYRYIWIDSCCIDKSSSSELSEAINSMYQWYGLADICYAYLADVPPGDDHEAEGSCFRESRWFTRGWTLQELIAPINVVFVSNDWAPIGSKHSLESLVESVTKINHRALLHVEPLDGFSVAQRLSWAADRETTRKEDRAYSLLGIFDINMPTLYGEGDRAFRRLQEQIMQRIPDQSLFAWGDMYQLGSWELPPNPNVTDPPTVLRIVAERRDPPRSPLPSSPVAFGESGSIGIARHGYIHHSQFADSHHQAIEYTPTPYGIRALFEVIPLTGDLLSRALRVHRQIQLELPRNDPHSRWYLVILGCENGENPGHLLGRVCYIPPSESGVEFVYCGYIDFHGDEYTALLPDLLPLSPEVIQRYRPHTELKTVYMRHPDRVNLVSTFRRHPYVAIKLMLLRETRDALRARGYSAELRGPDADHPTTHWLTLSRDERTVIIEFRYALEDGGRRFTMDAEVKSPVSESNVRLDCALDPGSRADGGIVSWDDSCKRAGWRADLWYSDVKFSAAKAGMTGIDKLRLEFAGTGVYVVRVDVVDYSSPPSSDV